MTLPLTGTIKLSDIRAEYGGPNPPRLKNYYLNGANVHQNPRGTIPSSGIIKLKDFYGGVGGYPISVAAASSYSFSPGIISASDQYHAFVFGYDGKVYNEGYAPSSSGDYRQLIGNWLTQGNAAGIYARATIISNQSSIPTSGGSHNISGNIDWTQIPSVPNSYRDTAGFAISFWSSDDYMPTGVVTYLVEFALSPGGPVVDSTTIDFILSGNAAIFAPGVGNVVADLVSSGANIDQTNLQITNTVLYVDGVELATWPAKSYGRLIILASSTFYPTTGLWSADSDCLRFTGGPTGNHQSNPVLPFTSGWVNMSIGQQIDINAQIGAGNEGIPAPTSWLKFRIEFATAPDPLYITHAQDFTIDVYA